MKRVLEVCCDSVQSAINAQHGGATRIELCENLAQGGVTPSAGKIRLCKQYVKIPVFVLIRPRKADFCYSDLEVECMIEDIHQAKEMGADGIVSGCLQADGTVDMEQTKILIQAAHPLPFTFHRAFDRTPDPFLALEQLIELGVDRILTSGQETAAIDALETLQQLAEKAEGQLTLLIGGKVRPDNIAKIAAIKGLHEFHSSAKKVVKSKAEILGTAQMGDEDLAAEYSWHEVDELMVQAMQDRLG